MNHVVVRTHGGLGNQIFQLLYARLYADRIGAPLYDVHDLRYAHGFTRSVEIGRAPAPSRLRQAVSSVRLPKLLTRAGLRRDRVSLFGTTYLDGYFQRPDNYADFGNAALRRELQRLREELRVSSHPTRALGMHLRLGDFFSSDAAVTAHLNERLGRLGPDIGIVTNEEERLRTPLVAEVLAAKRAWIVPTGDMTPEDVLRTLASFRRMDGNDSTLLFWASALSGMECNYKNPELRALRERFLQVLMG
ncbi:O-fucosyltransferase family protein [Sphingomonas radiodurans]|uniref:hypothetical protein n=1 Tax=Sphingomonas radiodurans TaxID=2890321 RepID=UPI001E2EAB50|nr:hypothetical protein [Sphingomonas radiodurans]WBH15098.1 hypothetical protein LLW23_09485 [Sphingomonas radiodurans]